MSQGKSTFRIYQTERQTRHARDMQKKSCAQVAAVDTNGAGDTFATAYMLALARRAHSPGAVANWVASRAVMQAQSCKPQCVLDGIVLGSSYAQYRQWVRSQVNLPRLIYLWVPWQLHRVTKLHHRAAR